MKRLWRLKIKQTEISGTEFRFLKKFASILFKQTPTTTYCIISFFKYLRKASSKMLSTMDQIRGHDYSQNEVIP